MIKIGESAMRNANMNDDVKNVREAVSQSGTSGECLAFCFVGLIAMIMVFAIMSVTGCI